MGHLQASTIRGFALALGTALLIGCSGSSKQTASEEPAPAETASSTQEQSPPPAEAEPAPEEEAPAPAPVSVSLSAADDMVASGGSTTLSWTSSGADLCEATGGWTGEKSVSGSENVGPIDASTTFTLSCSNATENGVAMVTVDLAGSLSVSWSAPTENVDGTPLDDLNGYRVYYGDFSGSYVGSQDVADSLATTTNPSLAAGQYYVAMTAIDIDGNESDFSNEVLKTAR
jgi:hypothetical protein